jgi:hypothetical protein
MRPVTLSLYYLPAPAWKPAAKRQPSRWRMSPEEAAARGLIAADIVPGSGQEVLVPETEEERQRVQVHYQSAGHDSVQPPRKD